MQLPAPVARVVIVQKETMLVVLQQVAARVILNQHTKHAIQVTAREHQDITQRAVIITALMDHLDALVQIHTNAQLGQLAQSRDQILQIQGQLAQSQQGTNFFFFSFTFSPLTSPINLLFSEIS
jgi:uncharacterized membrane protein affecting hemolysin expression